MAGEQTRRAGTARDQEPPKSLRGKLVLRSADVRKLYDTARALGGLGGAPYLNRLFDAASALDNGQLERVRQILARTRQEFEKSHLRLLRFEPEGGGDKRKAREEARLGLKKKQVEEVLGTFDGYLGVVERMVDVAPRAVATAAANASGPITARPSQAVELPVGFVEDFQASGGANDRLAVVERYFTCRKIGEPKDLLPDSLYFLRTRDGGYVLRTSADPPREVVRLTDAVTGQDVRPQRPEALLDQAAKGKFLALARRTQQDASEPPPPHSHAQMEPGDPLEAQNELLDRQLFNILMVAVKESGLEVSTDLIVQVRDNEFRKGEFHDAFEKLNQLATRYEMLAARRKEELRQHDQWLASGQSGLSMKEVELAKLRNANERTRLEHASHRFGLVVEPLRILARGGA